MMQSRSATVLIKSTHCVRQRINLRVRGRLGCNPEVRDEAVGAFDSFWSVILFSTPTLLVQGGLKTAETGSNAQGSVPAVSSSGAVRSGGGGRVRQGT